MGRHKGIEIRRLKYVAIWRCQRYGCLISAESKRPLAQGGAQAQFKMGPSLLPLQFRLSTLSVALHGDATAQGKLLTWQEQGLALGPCGASPINLGGWRGLRRHLGAAGQQAE
jgi:hypothetical protein